jgi:iron complex transport system permease protein
MLAAFLWVPHWPVMAKMGIPAVAALLGTALFLAVLSRIRLRSSWMVPLVGLVLAGVLEAAASFLALQFDMMQALKSWSNGDFSLVVEGRYELLWLSLASPPWPAWRPTASPSPAWARALPPIWA